MTADLMLLDSSNFRILSCNRGALNAGQANLASVSLQSAIDEGIGHASHVTGSLRISEGLIGGRLLKTVGIGNFALYKSASYFRIWLGYCYSRDRQKRQHCREVQRLDPQSGLGCSCSKMCGQS